MRPTALPVRFIVIAAALTVTGGGTIAAAQTIPPARVAILQAEERRAPTAQDLATIRRGAASGDAQTARIAVRALGRLERPTLIPDILPGLRHGAPEVRAEAANAVAQAAQPLAAQAAAALAVQGAQSLVAQPAPSTDASRRGRASQNSPGSTTPQPPALTATALTNAQAALIARLKIDADASVRAALCEAIARLPYRTAADVSRAEAAILANAADIPSIGDRLGVAKGLEALARLHITVQPPGDAAVAWLNDVLRAPAEHPDQDPSRDARVRRLAIEALATAERLTDAAIAGAARDPDAQVRRLAIGAAVTRPAAQAIIAAALEDESPMVRLEVLGAMLESGARPPGDLACGSALRAVDDPEPAVSYAAIDLLSRCDGNEAAAAWLERAVADLSTAGDPRAWPRPAHAIVALAAIAPDRARELLPQFASSGLWQLRLAAAQAAKPLHERGALETLSLDADDRVAHAALAALGQPDRPRATAVTREAPPIAAAELRRLASPRARLTIRGLGRIDLALFTAEAPITVLRFAQLANEGFYNGRSFDAVALNQRIQTGLRSGDAAAALPFRDEVGLWPHVRGAVAIAADGRDAGAGQIFIDLVDRPAFDHRFTVFAQVLNGLDVVDRIQPGDVIESVEILP